MGSEHVSQARDAARCKGLDRTCGNGIDSNLLLPQIVSQIANGALQGRFGDRHHVVVRHDLLRPVISHGDDGAAIFHQRSHGA